MTEKDYILERHWLSVAKRPPLKNSETKTTFNRDIFWYSRDNTPREQDISTRITYEDHRKVIETAVIVLGKTIPHEIALCILTHRFFTNYRNTTFEGIKDFNKDFSYLLKKIGVLFNHTTSKVISSSVANRLQEFKEPTLVSINHIAGIVTPVTLPNSESMQVWLKRYNTSANESTTYAITS